MSGLRERVPVRTLTRGLHVLTAVLVVLAVATLAVGALTYTPPETGDAPVTRETATNVTFVSEQGRLIQVDPHGGRLVAVHTDSKELLWVHDDYRRYFDVDPLDADRILFTAGRRTDGGFERIAVVLNWRTGERHRLFSVPHDTHDIDALGDGRFVIADKANDRVTIYDAETDRTVWEYDFADHFPDSAGGPPDDWTHLNDVDAVGNDSFLVSPRNFDRVLLLNRTTKEVTWTLGSEDDYGTLYEQHNPVLLDRLPPTVLVADSENDRVVEYERRDNGWEQVWAYRGRLNWPRDADRLPNGNTLVVDSRGDRVVEVTPGGNRTWTFNTSRHPYDAERLRYGDEPAGPTVRELGAERGPGTTEGGLLALPTTLFRDAYGHAGWILPVWVGRTQFLLLVLAALSVSLSAGTRVAAAVWRRSRLRAR